MPMVALSDATRRRLVALFNERDIPEAERLLREDCADVPLLGPATAKSLERIRFAALRVSGGDLPRLRDAIALAQIDWRDLLVAAGFADDHRAHERWEPT